ncbi:ATP-binding protein [Hymenobacter properus]|uniref:histidine kinase n=1 Tax=Hymenobacter properus TaxID=2791026 RepID=A0A931FL22_9BACT|nr:ATP-binding protein [Hymenobacter properus]MBF9141601.1 response regulator [Hymenobacter properus]MBR7720410.1 response regulator [Microvirga sp. SRT04]
MLPVCRPFFASCRRAYQTWGRGGRAYLLLGGLLATHLAPAQTTGRQPSDVLAPPARVNDLAHRLPADSLGRLLAYVRLAHAIQDRHRPDSAAYYLGRAWRLAGARQRQQRPAAVIALANELAGQHYVRGNFDSTLYYYQQAVQQFQGAGPDSSLTPDPATTRPTNSGQPLPLLLAGTLANAGSAGRVLGRLPLALRYYERARNLYQRQGNLNGIGWTQCLIGEAYAAQGNYPQAEQAYEQALVTYRRYAQPAANRDPAGGALADVLLSYYLPLLLEGHSSRPPAYASALAAEATALVRAAPYNALLLTRLNLVPAQVALQAGQPAEAAPWLSRACTWLRRGASADTAVAGWPARNQPYAEVKALTLGLTAWQQQPTHPERARSLLAEAVALLTRYPRTAPQPKPRQTLARIALAMGEPSAAVALLRPLLRGYQQSGSLLPLSQLTELLTQAYARVGRYDSAYAYSRRTQTLTDTLRQAQQFAALAASEARFRSREQASQIAHLTERERQQTRLVRLAAAGAGLLALLALAILLALRITRRLNRRLAAQTVQLQAQAERLQEQAGHLQMQTEHLQAQTERLGELDAAKNQFFANASHELRTPLTLVLAPLDTLLHAPAQKLPAAARAAVALAHRQAQRLHELVNRILDLTKLEAGQLAVQPVPTAVAPLLRNLLASFEPLAAARGLSLHGPERLPEGLHLLLDADKVAQILTNLLGNALNHTPAGGTVTLTAALPAADGYYTLTVQDTGPGIAPAEQERVFERFYQGKQHQAQGGTGLGLALSRELATLLGGTLTLASQPGQGAAFTLRFPATVLRIESEELRGEGVNELDLRNKRAETGPVSDDASISPTLNSSLLTLNSKPRVLVVEDHPDLRDYLRELLAPTYEVLTATDGQDALELLTREAPVDLVITDAMMPRLSGTELLAQLKADPARAGLPVLMLTARADEAHRRAALTVGVDDYLTKPFAPAELLARVQVLLARHNVRRQFAYRPEVAVPAGLAPLTDAGPATAATEGTGANEQLAQWQAQVVAHLADENFGPAELAGLLAVSERTLYRRLGESAGLTPAAWLRELRLNQARQLLEAGDFRTVVAVAEAVGFASASYFSSLYTERFGRRPSDYRKSKK